MTLLVTDSTYISLLSNYCCYFHPCYVHHVMMKLFPHSIILTSQFVSAFTWPNNLCVLTHIIMWLHILIWFSYWFCYSEKKKKNNKTFYQLKENICQVNLCTRINQSWIMTNWLFIDQRSERMTDGRRSLVDLCRCSFLILSIISCYSG